MKQPHEGFLSVRDEVGTLADSLFRRGTHPEVVRTLNTGEACVGKFCGSDNLLMDALSLVAFSLLTCDMRLVISTSCLLHDWLCRMSGDHEKTTPLFVLKCKWPQSWEKITLGSEDPVISISSRIS
jgi:hypothetical protein